MTRELPDLATIRAAVESMAPEALAALAPPAVDATTYLAAQPELLEVDVTDVAIDGPHGVVPARIYRHPRQHRHAAVVWAHGGGFVGGDLDMPEAHWVALSLASRGYGVLSVDYRKCQGGVHYPVPSDEVRAAWLWTAAHLDDLGAVVGRLHLAGASAGASIVAGVTKRLRDADGVMPASLLLAYPTLHPDLTALDGEDGGGALPDLAQAAGIFAFMNRNYAGSEVALADPYAFPGLGDVGRQPPVYIINSEIDLLRRSGEAYAAALRAAGVPVVVEYEPGTRHGHLNDPLLPTARRTIERMLGWLGAH